jgi:hypothetical protein
MVLDLHLLAVVLFVQEHFHFDTQLLLLNRLRQNGNGLVKQIEFLRRKHHQKAVLVQCLHYHYLNSDHDMLIQKDLVLVMEDLVLEELV